MSENESPSASGPSTSEPSPSDAPSRDGPECSWRKRIRALLLVAAFCASVQIVAAWRGSFRPAEAPPVVSDGQIEDSNDPPRSSVGDAAPSDTSGTTGEPAGNADDAWDPFASDETPTPPESRRPRPSERQLETVVPEAETFRIEGYGAEQYWVGTAAGDGGATEPVGFAFVTHDFIPAERLSETEGYAGQVPVLLGVDGGGAVLGMTVLRNHETPGVLRRATRPSVIERYVGKRLGDAFVPGKDVDAVSSATFTTNAIAAAVRIGGAVFRERVLDPRREEADAAVETEGAVATTGTETPPTLAGASVKMSWISRTTWRPIALFLVLVAGIGCAVRRNTLRRETATLIVSVVVLGVFGKIFFSLADALRIAAGTQPDFAIQPEWWIVVGLALGATVLFGRVWCQRFCPFGALTDLLWRIGKVRARVPRRLDRVLRLLPFGVLWATAIVYAATERNLTDAVEPFYASFNALSDLESTRMLVADEPWIAALVVIVLVGGVAFRRFWCLWLCPAGAALTVLSRLHILRPLPPARCAGCRSFCGEDVLCGNCGSGRAAPCAEDDDGEEASRV